MTRELGTGLTEAAVFVDPIPAVSTILKASWIIATGLAPKTTTPTPTGQAELPRNCETC